MLTDKSIVDCKAVLGLYLFHQTNRIIFFCMDFRHAAHSLFLFVCVPFLYHILAFYSGLKSSEEKAKKSNKEF